MNPTATLFAQTEPAPTTRAEKIRKYLSDIADGTLALNPEHCKAVHRAMMAVYNNQTETEKADKSTTQDNGKGFNGRDAHFGTDLVEKHQRYNGWTVNQVKAAAKMLRKYSKQIDAAYPKGVST